MKPMQDKWAFYEAVKMKSTQPLALRLDIEIGAIADFMLKSCR